MKKNGSEHQKEKKKNGRKKQRPDRRNRLLKTNILLINPQGERGNGETNQVTANGCPLNKTTKQSKKLNNKGPCPEAKRLPKK